MIDTAHHSPFMLSAAQKAQLDAWRAKFAELPSVEIVTLFPLPSTLEGLLTQLNELEKCVSSFRPFSAGHMRVLQEQFDTEYTYESNRIEGNTLSYQETDLVVNQGMTIGGKPLKDHLEAINHQQAIAQIRTLVSKEVPFTGRELLSIHSLILRGIDQDNAGMYRSVRVRIKGSDHVFPNPVKVPELMNDYFAFYDLEKDRLHPVLLASFMHAKLVKIHPFIDGNGRTARLIMNLMLMRAGYPITIIASENTSRLTYYGALEAFDHDENSVAFHHFVATNVRRWCLTYLEQFASDIAENRRETGYYFFKTISPFLDLKRHP